MAELDDLKKLTPEERLKKLKELIEKRNKEIEDKNKEIEEAKKLTEQAKKDEVRDETERLLEKIKVPDLERVEFDKLFDRHSGEELEKKVAGAPASTEEEVHSAIASAYQLTPDAPIKSIYSSAISLYNQAMDNGVVTPEMAGAMGTLQYAIGKKQEDIQAGIYTASEEVERQANMVKTIADKILSLYTGGVKKADGIQLWK